ncbi:DNA alkylation repair protein [Ulvibacterium sp.]|uniref:DNA alkylation repair protein n=1 Tax=Ulvibacterium sp. TaxID=2665914 RepID=UPI003BAA351A
MKNVLDKVRDELRNNVDENALATGQKFSKEKLKHYGVRTSVVRKIGKTFFKVIDSRSKSEIYGLCEDLWKSGYLEESIIASNWSHYLHKRYEPADFSIFQKWINKYIKNWASCDTFCNHTMGGFIEKYPSYVEKLQDFAKSENRWMRRAAAVSLIIPARKGKFLKDILEIADILLLDKDDLVQKGYGWMLKVASESHQKEVFDYVIKKKLVMPRTALRYAIEKMPKDLRSVAMAR